MLEVQKFEDGEQVINEGENGDRFYLVLEGNAKASKINPLTGNEEVVMNYREEMYFGELALLKQIPRQASIYAVG